MIKVAPGAALFSENEDGQMMYVLTAGKAEVIVNNRVVENLEHGSIVGEMGLVSPGPRSASVVAVTECEFVEVDEKRFQFLVQQTPFFATQVMRVMAERLRKVNQLVAPLEDI
ncbi:MAG: cyclic nucleotide-binding protein [Rhodocyclales bacterium GWA2_65_19]|nr:MAG: cyclic nucleotide-binding protein [Rhodocyclales bacterium GWA2_65_19]